MFDKVQQYVLEMAKLLQKRYVQISLDALNKKYLVYKVYKRWGFLPVTTDKHQTNTGCGKKGKHSFKLSYGDWQGIPLLQNCISGNPNLIAQRLLVMVKRFVVDEGEECGFKPTPPENNELYTDTNATDHNFAEHLYKIAKPGESDSAEVVVDSAEVVGDSAAAPPEQVDLTTDSDEAPPKKCLNCHTQKTPQWRVGPAGANTLCNACGTRYSRTGKV
jgi:hypothetical protein